MPEATPEMTIGSTMIVRQMPRAGSTEFSSTARPRPAAISIGTVTSGEDDRVAEALPEHRIGRPAVM